jgi:hypothetical protein
VLRVSTAAALSLLGILLISVPLLPAPAEAQVPPGTLLSEADGARYGEIQTFAGTYPGLLLVPGEDNKAIDGKYNQSYRAVSYGYCAERRSPESGSAGLRYLRRFAVHTSDRTGLPLARRVARMLITLYGENHSRLHFDHPYTETVDVWLTLAAPASQGADAGGEQYKNQIYLYNVLADRQPVEWAREVAHEYGHYALPGVTGFKDPEEWANGVLGERLFLKWLRDDLRAGTLAPEDVPLATRAQIEEYVARQSLPLIRRMAQMRDAYDSAPLNRHDAAGMDSYTALALYIDAVYGSGMLLNALQYTEPKAGSTFINAPDFLRGALAALRGATELTITPPDTGGENAATAFLIYLPAGDWKIGGEGAPISWRLQPDDRGVHPTGKNDLFVTRSEWRRLILTLPHPLTQPVRLVWYKKETELH